MIAVEVSMLKVYLELHKLRSGREDILYHQDNKTAESKTEKGSKRVMVICVCSCSDLNTFYQVKRHIA